jgi:isoleucyl-tRNA synthetase
MFAGQDPGQNMSFGYGPANDVARRVLTLWNTYRFLVLNANPEGFRPVWDEAAGGPESDNPLDRWVIARGNELARDCRAALDSYDTPSMTRAVEAFWDDLSNWYVRRSRPRFWEGDRAAFATLHHALVQCLRIMGPVTPFLADEMWQNLVANPCGPDAPSSVHLAGYPEPDQARIAAGLLGPMADVRAIAELGHRARAEAKQRLRQPLASAIVASGDAARLEALASSKLLDEVASELNVKSVTTTTDLESLVEQQVVPNFRALGPRLGAKVQEVRAALAAGDYRLGDDGIVHVGDEQLAVGEYELRSRAREGFEAQTDGALVAAIDTRLTDELLVEGAARDLVRFLQNVRKELGFDVSDRIAVSHSANERGAAVLAAHGDSIAREVLAGQFQPGDGGEHRFASGEVEISFAVSRT